MLLTDVDESACRRRHSVADPTNPRDPTIEVCLDYLPVNNCVAYHIGIFDSWDLGDAMMEHFNCTVFSFDPDPKDPVPKLCVFGDDDGEDIDDEEANVTSMSG